MSGRYRFNFSGDSASLFERAQELFAKYNVGLDGDEESGSFDSFLVAGSYRTFGNILEVTIDKNLPGFDIQSQVEKRLF